MLSGKTKIGVGAVAGVLSIIGMIVGATWAMDARLDGKYATKEEMSQQLTEVKNGLKDVLDIIENMKCMSIREELNELHTKEVREELTEYDRARLNNLRLRWQRECLTGDIS